MTTYLSHENTRVIPVSVLLPFPVPFRGGSFLPPPAQDNVTTYLSSVAACPPGPYRCYELERRRRRDRFRESDRERRDFLRDSARESERERRGRFLAGEPERRLLRDVERDRRDDRFCRDAERERERRDFFRHFLLAVSEPERDRDLDRERRSFLRACRDLLTASESDRDRDLVLERRPFLRA